MNNFTPWSALAGGALIGLSAVVLMWCNGRIAGISGILAGGSGLASKGERAWRWLFLLGLLMGSALVVFGLPGQPAFTPRTNFPAWLLLPAGLLVGFGSRLGSGCTSGHGICGIARLSPRSLAAVAVFMASGAVTVFLLRHVAELPV